MFQSECDEARSRQLARTVNLNLSFLRSVRTSTSQASKKDLNAGDGADETYPNSKYSSYNGYVFRPASEVPPELLTADRLIRESNERSHGVADRKMLNEYECWIPVDILPLLCLHPTQALLAITSYGVDLGYDNPSPPDGVSTMRECRDRNTSEVHGTSPPPSVISQALSTYLRCTDIAVAVLYHGQIHRLVHQIDI